MERMNDIELAKSFASQNAPSFSDVIARIEEIADLKPSRRRDLISGLQVVAKAIGLAPEACPADPIFLRPRIAKVRPAALAISEKSWTNTISNAKSALAVTGIVERKRGTYMPLSPVWQELWDKVRASGDDNIRLPMSRFPGFCSRIGVAPEEVTEETVADFRRALELSELRKDPEKVAWQLAHAWNRAVERIPGWPQRKLAKPQRHNRYALPIDAFPQSFRDDVDRLARRLACSDFSIGSDRFEPLAAPTIRHRLAQFRRFASALVHSGVPIDDLQTLADLLRLDRVETGVQWIANNRHNGETSQGLHETLLGLSMLGRELGIDPEQLAAIRGYARQLSGDANGRRTRHRGLTEKNRKRLRQFRDPAMRAAFLNLPAVLMAQATLERRPIKAARLAEAALMIAILTVAPMRRKNLAALEIDRHFDRIGNSKVYLILPSSEVKNKAPLEFELSPRIADLLGAFVAIHRARLTDPTCKWLFARVDGAGPVDESVLARRITETFERTLGLEMNMHLFRHLAAMFILERDPGAYDLVRRLLGHSELSTTVDAYTGMENLAATRFLSEIVENQQVPPEPSPRRKRP